MTDQHPIAVLGGGSFGTALANLLGENDQPVLHWMRDPQQAEAIRLTGENPRYLKGIKVHPVLQPVAELLSGKLLVSTTKGIEAQSFLLMSQILEDIAPQARIGVLSGPN